MPQAPSRERTGPDTHRDKANADIEAWGKVFLANLDTSAEAAFLPPPAGSTVPVSDTMSSIRVQLCPADADGPAVDCFMIDIWRKLSAMLPSTPLQQQTPVTTASAATGTFHVQLLRVCVLLECIREQHVASVSSSCDPRALLTFQEALKNLLLLGRSRGTAGRWCLLRHRYRQPKLLRRSSLSWHQTTLLHNISVGPGSVKSH